MFYKIPSTHFFILNSGTTFVARRVSNLFSVSDQALGHFIRVSGQLRRMEFV